MTDPREGFRRLRSPEKSDQSDLEKLTEWLKEPVREGIPSSNNAPTVLPQVPPKETGTPVGTPGSENSQRAGR